MTQQRARLEAPETPLAIEHSSPQPPARARFTAPQKAALVIAALGPEAAGPIIERIGDQHLKAFAAALARLQRIPQKELIAVISEFIASISADSDGLKGGFDEARTLVSHFKGDEDATKLLDDIDAPGGRDVWQKLAAVEDAALADYLHKKSAQTIAVILSRMDLDKASNILARLPDETARTVVARLTKPVSIRPEALDALAATVENEFLAPLRKSSRRENPGEKIGAMLNNLSEEKRASLLGYLEENAPDLIDDVKAAILTFKDIPERLPPKAVTVVTREVDAQVLLKAAKYGRKNAPETVEFLFANISQRLVQQYEEQMQEMKPITIAEAEAAQAEIMTAIRRLVAEGAFELNTVEKEETAEEEMI